MRKVLTIFGLLAISSVAAYGQQAANQQTEQTDKKCSADCPMHAEHSHDAASTTMNERGEKGMGFSQTATTHHFFLKPDGGIIQVETNDADDVANREMIQAHLAHIAQAFGHGDFDIPMFVHDTVPRGVPELKRLQDKIKYFFVKTPTGGRVAITTTDPDAIEAIHSFLKMQIKEHKTGDPTELHQ